MAARPVERGTPQIARQINDRIAMDLLLAQGPLSRNQLRELTGLSQPTIVDLVDRLVSTGLIETVGEVQSGRRGPNALLFGVVSGRARVAGIVVTGERIVASVSDITGHVHGTAEHRIEREAEPGEQVHRTLLDAVLDAGLSLSDLHATVVGTHGVIDPATGDVSFSWDLPSWRGNLLSGLRQRLDCPMVLENDVNLTGLAEHRVGAAADRDTFALLALGTGIGAALILDGRLHRGMAGGAGEVGYGAYPGLPSFPARPHGGPFAGGFQSMAGADAVRALAERHGLHHPTAAAAILAAREAHDLEVADSGGRRAAAQAFFAELAERVAIGVASICLVVDPGVVVLGGETALAAGAALAEPVQRAVADLCPTPVEIRVTGVTGNPVLRGALLAALDIARRDLYGPDVRR